MSANAGPVQWSTELGPPGLGKIGHVTDHGIPLREEDLAGDPLRWPARAHGRGGVSGRPGALRWLHQSCIRPTAPPPGNDGRVDGTCCIGGPSLALSAASASWSAKDAVRSC